MNFAPALARDRQRSSELPSFGKFQRGCEVDVVGLVALGIEKDLVPTDDGKFVGGRRSSGKSAFEGGRREEVEFGIDFAGPGRDVDVNREAIERIAPPLQRLASGTEFEAGEIVDWTVGRVFSGDPLRVVKSQVARGGGDLKRRVKNLARRSRCIHGNGDVWCGG